MSGQEKSAFSVRTAELAVAAAAFVLGAVVVWDSHRIGIRWAEEGPEAGYFPFYVGVLICAGSFVIALRSLRDSGAATRSFVGRGQLGSIAAVLIPTALFVVAIDLIGIYVSAILYIGLFMKLLGKYAWWRAAAVGFIVSAIAYLLFEVWFHVPLPKGPLENLLGLA